ERTDLRVMAGDAVGDVALEERQLLRRESAGIEASEVFGIRLADMNAGSMLGEEAQKALVPRQCAVVRIEDAARDVEAFEQLGIGAVRIDGVERGGREHRLDRL